MFEFRISCDQGSQYILSIVALIQTNTDINILHIIASH
jgi:hypothetical protein